MSNRLASATSLAASLLALAGSLTLASCSGDSFITKVAEIPRGLSLLDAGIEPELPDPLASATLWALTRDADTVALVSILVTEGLVGGNIDRFWAEADTMVLDPVGGPDARGVTRWEATLPARGDGRTLLYWFEAVAGEDSIALPPMRRDAPFMIDATPIELSFEPPTWPALRSTVDCPADWRRAFDGAEDQATLSPAPPFDIVSDPIWTPWRQAQVIYNLEAVTRGYGVEIGGQAYFFPLIILVHHEVSNQQLGGLQTALTYCPLTDSGLFFDTGMDPSSLPKNHDYAPIGLFNSNLTVGIAGRAPDRTTLYNQILGFGIRGPDRGTCLPAMAAVLIEFEVWRRLHPTTFILEGDPDLQDRYNYVTRPNPYSEYWINEEIRGAVARFDPRLDVKDRVMGVLLGDESVAVELSRDDFIHNDQAAGVPFVVLNANRTSIALERIHPISGEAFELLATGARFRGMPVYEDDTDAPGLWSFEGIALSGPAEGERLAWVPSMSVFWFAWYAIHPETRLIIRN